MGGISNMKTLTIRQLEFLYPHAPKENLIPFTVYRDKMIKEFDINTQTRYNMFMAQLSHESGGFRYMKEQRSRISAERKYGYKTRVGKILGNTLEGDGQTFLGRGMIQLTGKWNYGYYGKILGLPLHKEPWLAEVPENALNIALHYWDLRKCNQLADQGLFEGITLKINGGLNGQADRNRWLQKIDNLIENSK